MVKVMRRDVYPGILGRRKRDDKAYTAVEERIFAELWDTDEGWPRGYDPDWLLLSNEGTPEAIAWAYNFMDATSLTFAGSLHRPSSLQQAQPAPAPAPDRRRPSDKAQDR